MLRLSSILLLFCGLAILTLNCPALVSAQQDQTGTSPQGAAPSGKSKAKTPPAAGQGDQTGPADAVHDVMSQAFKSANACDLADPGQHKDAIKQLNDAIDNISKNKNLEGWSSLPMAKMIAKRCPRCDTAAKTGPDGKKPSLAYIFHLVTWRKGPQDEADIDKNYVPVSSDWHVYETAGNDTLKYTGITADGEPRIYNKKNLIIVGVDTFSADIPENAFMSAYTSTVTQGTPQNQTDLSALISALAGLPSAGVVTAQAVSGCGTFLAAAFQPGTSRLPYDAKITVASDTSHSSKSPTVTQPPPPTGSPSNPALQSDLTAGGSSCTQDICADLSLATNSNIVEAAISGSFTGSLVFEVSSQPGVFVPAEAMDQSGMKVTKVTAPGKWTIVSGGASDVRVRAETLTGKASVSLQRGGATTVNSSKPAPTTGDGSGPQKAQVPSSPSPGVFACTGNFSSLPCTATRTFTSEDLEWWDVSIGIAIPGVRESKYSIVNNALSKSVTTHTDLYAMLDLYPFAPLADKNEWAPHFNLGVPLTSQSLYRPYFGLAESVGGLLSLLPVAKRPIKLPMNVNVFAGMVWMKTTYVTDNPTTAAQLASDSHPTRVWKPVFGIEVPISAIASKIKGAGSKNTNGSSSKSSSGS